MEAATDKKAENVLVLNVSEVTSIADLFVRTRVGERHSGSLGTSAMSAKEAVSVLLRALPD